MCGHVVARCLHNTSSTLLLCGIRRQSDSNIVCLLFSFRDISGRRLHVSSAASVLFLPLYLTLPGVLSSLVLSHTAPHGKGSDTTQPMDLEPRFRNPTSTNSFFAALTYFASLPLGLSSISNLRTLHALFVTMSCQLMSDLFF